MSLSAYKSWLILHSKSERTIFNSVKAVIHLTKHLEGKDYLFITQRGAVYSDHFWIPAFNKRLKMLGIHRKGLTCYSFRHSMATSLLRQDVNVHKIAKLLGNSVNAITESYEHLVIEDVEKALNKHPLIRKHLKPSESEILTELENVLKAYDLRYNIKQKQGRLNVEVIL